MKKVGATSLKMVADMVTVAIIDDGVDLEDLQMPRYIKGGWYTDGKEPGHRNMNTWYVSDQKHGTEMARLVQRLCPFVSLYIGKLDTRKVKFPSIAESAAEVRP